MGINVWLPLVTLVGGYVGSLVTEALRERRIERRERIAREAEARVRRESREADFQRETLLRTQDALFRLNKATWDLLYEILAIAAARASERSDGLTIEGTARELNEEWRATQAELTILQVRIADGRLREAVATLRSHCSRAVSTAMRAEAFEELRHADEAFEAANDRLGLLLREFY